MRRSTNNQMSARKPREQKRIPRLHRPRRESLKSITTRLYRIWSEVVHKRAGGLCEVCGCGGKLDAHHVQPRQICSGLRFEPANGVCLCSSHHKFGRRSAHKGMLWFARWFQENRPNDYAEVMANLDKEIDCHSRDVLYAEEHMLRSKYGPEGAGYIDGLGEYDVEAYTRDGRKVTSRVSAHNLKAAEYIFFTAWPKDETPLKGISSTRLSRNIDGSGNG